MRERGPIRRRRYVNQGRCENTHEMVCYVQLRVVLNKDIFTGKCVIESIARELQAPTCHTSAIVQRASAVNASRTVWSAVLFMRHAAESPTMYLCVITHERLSWAGTRMRVGQRRRGVSREARRVEAGSVRGPAQYIVQEHMFMARTNLVPPCPGVYRALA